MDALAPTARQGEEPASTNHLIGMMKPDIANRLIEGATNVDLPQGAILFAASDQM